MENKHGVHNISGNLRKLLRMSSAAIACKEEKRKDEKKKREMTFPQTNNGFCTCHTDLHKWLNYL